GAGETLELWKQVERAVERWEERYEALTREHGVSSLLLYEDGADRLRITDYRFSRPRTFDLDEPGRALYLACESTRSLDALCAVSPGRRAGEVTPRLEALRSDPLVFREGKRYLSLAIPADAAARLVYEEPAGAAKGLSQLPVVAG